MKSGKKMRDSWQCMLQGNNARVSLKGIGDGGGKEEEAQDNHGGDGQPGEEAPLLPHLLQLLLFVVLVIVLVIFLSPLTKAGESSWRWWSIEGVG